MSYKMKGFPKHSTSALKKAGIFMGEGKDRVRISSEKADELEAEGKKVTRTGADDPDKARGEAYKEKIGTKLASEDEFLQEQVEADADNPADHDYKHYKPDEFRTMKSLTIRKTSPGGETTTETETFPYTTKDIEKDIRKKERKHKIGSFKESPKT